MASQNSIIKKVRNESELLKKGTNLIGIYNKVGGSYYAVKKAVVFLVEIGELNYIESNKMYIKNEQK